MAVKTINTELLQKMFLAGAANLEAKKEFINELNVFPVPDGDTGTNMTLTILSAAKEVKALENPDMVAIAKAISSGSLRGARGNSGVILSQLLRGFTKEIREHKEIDTITLAKACERATARHSIQGGYEAEGRNNSYCSKGSIPESGRACRDNRRSGYIYFRSNQLCAGSS